MVSRIMVAVLALTFAATYIAEAEVVTDGLLMYWTFDQADVDGDTAKDVVGGNDGTIFGDPEVVEGKFNQALELAGNNDYLEVDLPNASLAEGATLEFWFKQDAPLGWAIITKVSESIEISIGGGTLEIWSSAGRFNPEGSYSDGEWHHMAVTVAETEVISYVDSEKKGELLSNLILGGVPAVTVGRDPGFTGWFIGIIDEFRIYERPLSAEEVQLNMEAKKVAVEASADKLAETWGKIKDSR